MKIYIGIRSERTKAGGLRVFFTDSRDESLKQKDLPPRLDLYSHSPDGFEWGYGGSGPAQLALALLADALQDDKRAVMLHQAFKWKIVGRFPKAMFIISEKEILEAAHQIEGEQKEVHAS